MQNILINPQEIYENIINNIEISTYLNKIKQYHRETYEHSLRVGRYAIELAIENNCDTKQIYQAGTAGLLHDIGKIKINKEIINKTTKLNEFEKKEIEKHSRYSYKLLENFSDKDIKKIVVMHHEFDSKNSYPRDIGKNNMHRSDINQENILKIAEIVAMADVFDALSSQRNYKEKFSNKKIKDIMFKSNFFWNKNILNTLFKL